VVGDPRQSHPVGAGGLWPHAEQVASANLAHIELTRNVRANDPADRRDQQRFRDGHHQQAVRDYQARGRVTITPGQREAEDTALDAAQADRQARHRTLVIAQTSNEHLDELNARAQAIRIEHSELSEQSVAVADRPYRLHAGDHVQIRRTIHHDGQGQLRNGTIGEVLDVDPDRELLTIGLADERQATLDRAQTDRADVRLSYVQHPFPAQGQTTDTTHLIVSEHATQEGCYVALTRARDSTRVYASREQLEQDDRDELAVLADRMSRPEPEVASIDTPLAHESEIEHEHARELGADDGAVTRDQLEPNAVTSEPGGEREHGSRADDTQPHVVAVLGPRPRANDPNLPAWDAAAAAIERYRTRYNIGPEEPIALGPEPPPGQFAQRHDRNQAAAKIIGALHELDRPADRLGLTEERVLTTEASGDDASERERHRSIGWEP
jgi:hypothetical protein